MKELLDPNNSSQVEINPMVVGMKSSQCKINQICVHIASGFGQVISKCKYLYEEKEDFYCTAIIQD